jgi:hypothetical protein
MTTATRHIWGGNETAVEIHWQSRDFHPLDNPSSRVVGVLPSGMTPPRGGCKFCLCRRECYRIVRTPDPLLCEGEVVVRFDSGEIVRM